MGRQEASREDGGFASRKALSSASGGGTVAGLSEPGQTGEGRGDCATTKLSKWGTKIFPPQRVTR